MDPDQFLHRHGIALVRQTHPAVMTCAQSDLLVAKLAATGHRARVVDVPVRASQGAAS
mgnify:CR=1 FL=1